MKGRKIDAFLTIGSSWPQRSPLNCPRAFLGLAYSGCCTSFTNSSTIVRGELYFVLIFVFILRTICRQYGFINRFVSVNTRWLQEHIRDGISFHMIITVAASRLIITCLLFLILSVRVLLTRMMWTYVISSCIAKQDHSLLLFITTLLEYFLKVKPFDWDVFYVIMRRLYFWLETLAIATMTINIESRLHELPFPLSHWLLIPRF